MAHMYRHDAKKSHVDKIKRLTGGYASKKASGGHAKPKIAHRKRGGKVMKAEGGKAMHRLDKKSRKHREMGGSNMPEVGLQPMMKRVEPRDYGIGPQGRLDTMLRTPLTPAQLNMLRQGKDPFAEGRMITPVRKKGGKITKGDYVGGHESEADLIADKQLIKKAFAMHDKQEHAGKHTNLSKLKKGGHVRKRADGGRLPGGVIGKIMKKKGGKPHTNVNVVVGSPHPTPGLGGAPAMPTPLPRVPVPMPAMGPAPGAMPAPGMPPVGGAPGMPPMPMRKRGGRVDNLTPVKAEGMKAGTQVTHTPGKNDLAEIRKYPPITYKRGGAVYPKMRYGAGSGEGRLEKIEEYGHKK
jgi:hypothetical protein